MTVAATPIQIEFIRVPYKEVDGMPIPTDVYIPLQKATGDHALAPVLIMCHGGGFIVGWSRMNNADTIEDCLERGWIVLSIEYRLCPGVDLLEGPITDARDVLRWAQAGGLATALEKASISIRPDPERVMAMGASAGGHLALSMVGQHFMNFFTSK
jgi:acetyl esterase/lipase